MFSLEARRPRSTQHGAVLPVSSTFSKRKDVTSEPSEFREDNLSFFNLSLQDLSQNEPCCKVHPYVTLQCTYVLGLWGRLPSPAAPRLPTASSSPRLCPPKRQGILALLMLSSCPWCRDGLELLELPRVLPALARGMQGASGAPQQQREAGAAGRNYFSCCPGQVHLEFTLLTVDQLKFSCPKSLLAFS